MNRTAVINVVGLTKVCIGEFTPEIARFAQRGTVVAIRPAFPAVTCTAQANYLTGKYPKDHGVVGNGWYHRELAEVHFWKQSNHLVHGLKVWDDLREHSSRFTCAQLFWWFNMYSSADYSITPRPLYPADGRKIFDIYTEPFSIRSEIKKDLGEFPFPAFWGPAAGVNSPAFSADAASRWIAESAKWIENKYGPTLSLIYLPHLDYNLQRFGVATSRVQEDFRRIDKIVGDLIRFFEQRGVTVFLLSEYGITDVNLPLDLNRLFRRHGWLRIKEELNRELLDCGASRVFAIPDHQVCHIYVNDPTISNDVKRCLEGVSGVEAILDRTAQSAYGIDHSRSGDFIAIARKNAWFTYYFWEDDRLAPDYARCVDIHRKPGYDPVELFLDPRLRFPKLKIFWRLLQKKLSIRMLMDVVPLDGSLVRGSHGRPCDHVDEYPILVRPGLPSSSTRPIVDSTDVYQLIRDSVL